MKNLLNCLTITWSWYNIVDKLIDGATEIIKPEDQKIMNSKQ
jgi:hypothetical protein